MGPPGTSRLSAAGMPVTAALAVPVMPVRHAAPARATAASVVVRIRLVRNPAPLLRLKQPSNFSPASSRDHPERYGGPGLAADARTRPGAIALSRDVG